MLNKIKKPKDKKTITLKLIQTKKCLNISIK